MGDGSQNEGSFMLIIVKCGYGYRHSLQSVLYVHFVPFSAGFPEAYGYK